MVHTREEGSRRIFRAYEEFFKIRKAMETNSPFNYSKPKVLKAIIVWYIYTKTTSIKPAVFEISLAQLLYVCVCVCVCVLPGSFQATEPYILK